MTVRLREAVPSMQETRALPPRLRNTPDQFRDDGFLIRKSMPSKGNTLKGFYRPFPAMR